MNAKILFVVAGLLAVSLVSGCSSGLAYQRSPAGTVAADLERAGANYQATEAMPDYRRERPNESEPRYR